MASPDGAQPFTVAIIGAGFSGTLVAAQLLRQYAGGGLRVVLIDRTGTFGRGLAYGGAHDAHLLNVPAWNMSALPDDRDHFVRFCRGVDPAFGPQSFAPRWLYGRYVESILQESEQGSAATLERRSADVSGIDLRSGARPRVGFSDGSWLSADRIVLATGHQLSRLQPFGEAFDRLPMYVHDPWSAQVTDRLATHDSVLLIGTGHTAVDVLFTLLQSSPARRVVLLSRHGWLPQDYGDASPPLRTVVPPRAGPGLVREQLRQFRRRARQAGNSAGDWRLVMRELRPTLPELWQRLPLAERRRFLRHLRPWWDVHRHRLAPLAAQRLDSAVKSGQVEVIAGRVSDALYLGSVARVTLALRGGGRRVLDPNRIVNCTGPCYDVARSASGLLRGLLHAGLLRQDALRLGLDVDADYRPLDARGNASDVLRYVGPLLRARDWEAIAVPELRGHAMRLATLLLADQRASRTPTVLLSLPCAHAPYDFPVLNQPLGAV